MRLITTADYLHAFAAQEICAEEVMRGIGIKSYSHLISVLFDHKMICPPFSRCSPPEFDEKD